MLYEVITCTATSRAIIVGDIYDTVVEKLLGLVAKAVPGNGLDKTTTMGPSACKSQYDKVRSMIGVGVAEGLTLLAGTADLPELDEETGGFFIAPTIFGDRNNFV